MYVEHVTKTEKGDVTFKGEMTQLEFDFVFGVGMNVLIQQGSLNLGNENSAEDVTVN